MILLNLFWSFFKIGMFSIGGGMATMPLIQRQVVDLNHWLTLKEFNDLITISQMTPGPIAINSATFIGIQIAGIPGAIIATFGCVLPSGVIVSIIAWLYFKYRNLEMVQGILSGLRPAVIALILSAGLSILVFAIYGTSGFTFTPNGINYIAIIIFIMSLFLIRRLQLNPIIIMLSTGLVGGAIYLILDLFI